jgi:hypothetical protein
MIQRFRLTGPNGARRRGCGGSVIVPWALILSSTVLLGGGVFNDTIDVSLVRRSGVAGISGNAGFAGADLFWLEV